VIRNDGLDFPMSYILLMSGVLAAGVASQRGTRTQIPLYAATWLCAAVLLAADMTSPLTLSW
jgi:hypothetical protein